MLLLFHIILLLFFFITFHYCFKIAFFVIFFINLCCCFLISIFIDFCNCFCYYYFKIAIIVFLILFLVISIVIFLITFQIFTILLHCVQGKRRFQAPGLPRRFPDRWGHYYGWSRLFRRGLALGTSRLFFSCLKEPDLRAQVRPALPKRRFLHQTRRVPVCGKLLRPVVRDEQVRRGAPPVARTWTRGVRGVSVRRGWGFLWGWGARCWSRWWEFFVRNVAKF